MEKEGDVVEIPLKGELKLGPNFNSIKILKKDIVFNGTQMAMDLLAEITGITYDASLNWRFDGEKGVLYSLEDYLVQILKERFGREIPEEKK